MFKYVLFDLDGTLTDPREGITKSVQYALAKQGIEESDLTKLEPFIGPPLVESFAEFYGMNAEQALQAKNDYRERFEPIGMLENEAYPGMAQMLSRLKEAGVILAVASSKPEPYIGKILAHFSMDSYFDVMCGSCLDGKREQKSEVIEETLRRLGIEKGCSECAMVGDRKFDILGAHCFGLYSVGVSYGYAGEGELEAAEADFIADTVEELGEFLLK